MDPWRTLSFTKDHSIGLEARSEIVSRQYAWLAWSFPPTALGKAYEHHVGKVLHSAAYL